MGGSSSTPDPPTLAATRSNSSFEEDELTLLDTMFRDLAARSPGATMDRTTFLAFFNFPGMLGQRLFTVFDSKQTGVIDFEEFILGLSSFWRGSMKEKIEVLFRMYDLNGQGSVTRAELSTMLFSLLAPRNVLHSASVTLDIQDSEQDKPGGGAANGPDHEESSRAVEKIVDSAFRECDVNADGSLQYDEFATWIRKNQYILDKLDSMVLHAWDDPRLGRDMKHKLRHMSNAGLTARVRLECVQCGLLWKHCPQCGEKLMSCSSGGGAMCTQCGVLPVRVSSCVVCGADMEEREIEAPAQPPVLAPAVSDDFIGPSPAASPWPASLSRSKSRSEADLATYKEGELKKRGKRLKKLVSRWFVLRGNCLYAYRSREAEHPRSAHFLHGYFFEEERNPGEDVDSKAARKHFAFRLTPPDTTKQPVRILYASSAAERDDWLRALRCGSRSLPIKEFYAVGKQIGRGRFSTVHEAIQKKTNRKFAVKIIPKASIADDDAAQEALRTEIAILKIVRHPSIIRVVDFFEGRKRIYIVMQLTTAGDLFDRLVQLKTLDEPTVRQIMWRLLSAVRYLHSLGIVHRDLKLENILCPDEDDVTNILISDFGLSKFNAPDALMSIPVGTVAYVAPEVLKDNPTYSSAVDLWSLGVIMYMLLSGTLPYNAPTPVEIRTKTMNDPLVFPEHRFEDVSESAKSLVRALMVKDPKRRITIVNALKHKWFDGIHEEASADLEPHAVVADEPVTAMPSDLDLSKSDG